MRRLTNASTGALGSRLASTFVDAGHRVLLFRGEGSTAPPPDRPVTLSRFATNDDLAGQLLECGKHEEVDVVLHAAALCDFRVVAARSGDGSDALRAKISSRAGRIVLELEPATKVLPRMRGWFPAARIVGWKFELNGGRDEALAAVWRQMQEADTDACVLNGRAWGEGFALCEPGGRASAFRDVAELGAGLLAWLGGGSA